MDELLKALNGGKGSLDAWLECCNEDEVRAAILALVSPTETLRDKFAGQALAGGIKNGAFNSDRGDGENYHDWLARCAYKAADAMLAARSAS